MSTRRVCANYVSLLAFAILAVFAVGLSQEARSKDDPKPVKSWRLEGRVVDDQGQPVTGARVFTNELPFLPSDKQSSTVTDNEGDFMLEVAHRLYGRIIRASDDKANRQAFFQYPSMTEKSGPPKSIELVLLPSRELLANVVDQTGVPVAGATVAVTALYEQFEEVATDKTGHAMLRLPAKLPLNYVVAVKPGTGFDYWQFRSKNAPKSDPHRLAYDHSKPLQFVLNGVRSVAIRVVDDKDKPITGVRVYPWSFRKPNKGGQNDELNLSGMGAFTHQTDDQGVARFDFIPNDNMGKVTFWARADGYHSPDRHQFDPASQDSEIVAKLIPLVDVNGRVVFSDGKSGSHIEVLAAGAGYGMDDFRSSTRTDAHGKFEFQVYPDQYYQFVAGNREWASPAINQIVRAGSPVEGVELILQPATRVFGRVTIGANNAAMPDQYISLYHKEAATYYDLPEEERLPNPKDSHSGISPRTVRSINTDSDGRYEFFVGPGKYYIWGPHNVTPPTFEITDAQPLEINLHADRPELVPISGRVVMRDDPKQGIAGAKVDGASRRSLGRGLQAVSGDDGRFQTQRGTDEMLVYAVTDDRKFAGLTSLGADDAEVTISVAPTAIASGRLIDEETIAPIANRQIDYGVRIEFDDSTFSYRFGGSSTTDADGQFNFVGLVTGQEYVINAVTESDGEGRPRSWRTVAKVNAPNTEAVALGEVKLPAPYRPPTIEDRVAKAFADPRTLEERLRERFRDTRLAYQRVLAIVGDPEDPFVKQFYELEHDKNLSKEIYNYLFLPLSTVDAERKEEAQKLLARLGIAWPQENEALLAVLDEEGVVIVSKPFHEFASDGTIENGKLAAYLHEHAPELPDAETKLADALANAKKDGKRVLVQVSGARCGWCFVLSRYLDDYHDLINKEFAYVKLDSRLENGQAVIERVRPSAEGGIPWMVVLNENGDPLITSDGPDGNIGYPGEPEGQVHFAKMLRADVKKLTDDEIKTLIAALAKANN